MKEKYWESETWVCEKECVWVREGECWECEIESVLG